jgi:hypothetical protein
VLDDTKSVLLIDWPSRDVPDALARSGLTVVSQEGPDSYVAYEVKGDAVRVRDAVGPPEQVDLVYAHRPMDELPEIVDTARSVDARAIWIQSGLDEKGAKDPRGCWLPTEEVGRARETVEAAGLVFIAEPYIADVVRARTAR